VLTPPPGGRSRATTLRLGTRHRRGRFHRQGHRGHGIAQQALQDAHRIRDITQGGNQAKQGNQRFILSPEQEAEIEKFRHKEAEANRQLKEERKQLRHDIDLLEKWVKWLNIAAIPALVSVTGLGLALYKRKPSSTK